MINEINQKLTPRPNKLQMQLSMPILSTKRQRIAKDSHLIPKDGFSLILELPNEIVTEIFFLLNQVDVLSLMMVNKKLYKLGLTKFYHSIYLNDTEMDHVRFAISSSIYTPFHRKYTITNRSLYFMNNLPYNPHKHLIREIVTNFIRPEQYKVLTNFSQIKTSIEYGNGVHYVLEDIKDVDISLATKFGLYRHNYNFLSDVIIENNYSIKELFISNNIFGNVPLDIIPKLKGLEILIISSFTQRVLDTLHEIGVSKLQLKTLVLNDCNIPDESTCEYLFYIGVNELFDLECIQTFGYSSRCDSLLPSLMMIVKKLRNLKHLDLHYHKNYHGALVPSQNSLTSLCLNDYSNGSNSILNNNDIIAILSRQERSLTRICLSNHSHSDCRRDGEIDRVYRSFRRKDDDPQVLNFIERLLQKGKRFSKLNTIVIEDFYYLVKRIGTENPEIICFDYHNDTYRLRCFE